MHPDLRHRWEALEADRIALFRRLEPVDEQVLSIPPAHGAWSVAQILRHLQTGEGAALGYLRKKLRHRDGIRPASPGDRFRLALLRVWLALPLKARAPRAFAHPPADEALAAVLDDYANLRNEWAAELDTLPDAYVDGRLFRHPVTGRADLRGALTFFRAHFAHHGKQIDRILKATDA